MPAYRESTGAGGNLHLSLWKCNVACLLIPCSVTVSLGACHANTALRFPGDKIIPAWGCSLTWECVTSLVRGSGWSSESAHIRIYISKTVLMAFKILSKWVHVVLKIRELCGNILSIKEGKKNHQVNILRFSIWATLNTNYVQQWSELVLLGKEAETIILQCFLYQRIWIYNRVQKNMNNWFVYCLCICWIDSPTPFCIYIPGPHEVLIQPNKKASNAFIPCPQECCKDKSGKVLNWVGDETCSMA